MKLMRTQTAIFLVVLLGNPSWTSAQEKLTKLRFVHLFIKDLDESGFVKSLYNP